MPSLALAVLQRDRALDTAALTALGAVRVFLVRPPELEGEAPPAGVGVLTATVDTREQAAALVRRASGADAVVVLEAGERVSAELGAALTALAAAAPAAAFSARAERAFLGRTIDLEPIVLAWRGEPQPGMTPTMLTGTLVKAPAGIAALIARLDIETTRLAATRSTVEMADFTIRPLVAFGRRLFTRRRHGVPGLILSVIETYGELLVAAKTWERTRVLAPRATAPLAARLPPGFVAVEGRFGWVIVRVGTGERLVRALLEATPESADGEPLARGGRGATWALTLDDGARAVLRWYRRGGAFRRLLYDRYFGWRPRPILELGLLEEARRRGVPAVEVLAARVDRLAGGFYRGAIATREVTGAETLIEVLRRTPAEAERRAVAGEVARVLRAMHDAGVHHRDLNATNILLRRGEQGVEVHLIDFDRAQLLGRVPWWLRRRALRRLARSLRSLDAARLVTGEDLAVFHGAYGAR